VEEAKRREPAASRPPKNHSQNALCLPHKGNKLPYGNRVSAAFTRISRSAGPKAVGNVPGLDVWILTCSAAKPRKNGAATGACVPYNSSC
jgi:hypothetical protein